MSYLTFFLFSALFIILLFANLSYAQPPDNITGNIQRPKEMDQWLTHTDPEGKFTIQYPPFIEVVPKQNRFERHDLTFSNEGSTIIGDITWEKEISNDTGSESLRKLIDAVNYVVDNVNVLKEYSVIDSNDTQIKGNFAISQIVHTITADDTEYGTWDIFSYIDNKLFHFSYRFTPQEFDEGLQTVQKMLNSINFSGSNATQQIPVPASSRTEITPSINKSLGYKSLYERTTDPKIFTLHNLQSKSYDLI